eukprot:1159943-Pelagomonas_calceolata.AAC.9
MFLIEWRAGANTCPKGYLAKAASRHAGRPGCGPTMLRPGAGASFALVKLLQHDVELKPHSSGARWYVASSHHCSPVLAQDALLLLVLFGACLCWLVCCSPLFCLRCLARMVACRCLRVLCLCSPVLLTSAPWCIAYWWCQLVHTGARWYRASYHCSPMPAQGVLKLGQEIEVRPGIITKDAEGRVKCIPIYSRVVSLFAEGNELHYAVPGGLIGVGLTVGASSSCWEKVRWNLAGSGLAGAAIYSWLVERAVDMILGMPRTPGALAHSEQKQIGFTSAA